MRTICIFAFSWLIGTTLVSDALAFDSQDPSFDDSVIEVNDVVFTDPAGYIAVEEVFSFGVRLLRRVRFVTKNGHELLLTKSDASNSAFLYTPGDDFKLTYISNSQYRIENLRTGQVTSVMEPSGGWNETAWVSAGNPTNSVQREFEDLRDAWADYVATQMIETHIQHPLGKYVTTTNSDPAPRCTADSELCGRQIAAGFGAIIVGGGIGLLYGGPHGAVLGGIIAGGVFIVASPSFCDCAAYEPPPTDNNGSVTVPFRPGMCEGSFCGNSGAPMPSRGWMMVCDGWSTPKTGPEGQTVPVGARFCSRYIWIPVP
jgi:hypothetical protein